MNNGMFFFSKQPGKPTELVKKSKAQRPTTPTHPQGDPGGTPQPALIPHVPRFTPSGQRAALRHSMREAPPGPKKNSVI